MISHVFPGLVVTCLPSCQEPRPIAQAPPVTSSLLATLAFRALTYSCLCLHAQGLEATALIAARVGNTAALAWLLANAALSPSAEGDTDGCVACGPLGHDEVTATHHRLARAPLLCAAAASGNLDTVQCLIDAGAPVDPSAGVRPHWLMLCLVVHAVCVCVCVGG
ncbi:hypothetical protein [Silvimonas sp.]|uniref:hypothetical protein n=1 Tax=Silvimonas sp. TaxID=2650811 RepID=UPI00386AE235